LITGFVDIHSHVLHGVDDGSPSLEISTEMLAMAVKSGTTEIVATPHANSEFSYHGNLVSARVEELRRVAPEGISIHQGCDLHLSSENVKTALSEPGLFTINGGNYLLVELPDFFIYPNIQDIFQRFLAQDIVPVITHPERNVLLQERLRDLARWVELDCLIQITAQSLTGDFGRSAKQFADDLLRRGLVHFVASDSHDCEHRPPRLDLAYAYVLQHFGIGTADLIFKTNPLNALRGEAILSAEQGGVRETKWYQRLF
jgi:protein-tyrosine phosphatase